MDPAIEEFNSADNRHLAIHRNWLSHQSEEDLSSAKAKLQLIQHLLDAEIVKKNERVKVESLGVAYGDILTQEVPELEWIAVEDKDGRELALRWKQTSILIYPITDMSRQISDYLVVDVGNMLEGFKASIYDALADIA